MDKKYSEKHDAHYDADTGKWLEDVCDSLDCHYCVGRPEDASEEKENETC